MTLDPFQILGLPRTFNIDAAALRRAYLAQSASLHPDLATDPRFEFLSKPFQPSMLARRVRECLDRTPPGEV